MNGGEIDLRQSRRLAPPICNSEGSNRSARLTGLEWRVAVRQRSVGKFGTASSPYADDIRYREWLAGKEPQP